MIIARAGKASLSLWEAARSGAHHDLTLLASSQQLHERRLYEDDAGHVGIGDNGGDPENARRQLTGQEDGGRSIGAADDPDHRGLLQRKVGHERSPEGYEYAYLGRGSKQQHPGIGDHRTEVGHSAQAQEDDRGQDVPEGQTIVQDYPEDSGLLVSPKGLSVKSVMPVRGRLVMITPRPMGSNTYGSRFSTDGEEDEEKPNEEHDPFPPIDIGDTGVSQEVPDTRSICVHRVPSRLTPAVSRRGRPACLPAPRFEGPGVSCRRANTQVRPYGVTAGRSPCSRSVLTAITAARALSRARAAESARRRSTKASPLPTTAMTTARRTSSANAVLMPINVSLTACSKVVWSIVNLHRDVQSLAQKLYNA